MIFSLPVRLEQFQSWVLFRLWCCVTRVPIQNFSFSNNRFSIWLSVKPDVLLTTSSMTNAKYLNISLSQHLSIKCVAILQQRTFFLLLLLLLLSSRLFHFQWKDEFSKVIFTKIDYLHFNWFKSFNLKPIARTLLLPPGNTRKHLGFLMFSGGRERVL